MPYMFIDLPATTILTSVSNVFPCLDGGQIKSDTLASASCLNLLKQNVHTAAHSGALRRLFASSSVFG